MKHEDPAIGHETKRRFQLWLKPSVLNLAEEWYAKDNCGSKSEFIEKAIQFYVGYLSVNRSQDYLPNVVTSTLKSIVSESDNRISRMLFKLAVELAITMNVVAAAHDIDVESLERLRGSCVQDVKRSNGSISFDDARRWQQG